MKSEHLNRHKIYFGIVMIGLISLWLITRIGVAMQNTPMVSEAPKGHLYTESVINSAQSIEIETAEDTYTLTRNDTGWTLREHGDFPLYDAAITSLTEALTSAIRVAPSTALPDRYDAIGVSDPDAGGFGAALTVEGDENVYIFGRKDSYQYMRRRGDDQAWRLSTLLPPLHNPLRWISLDDDTLPRIDLPVTHISMRGGGPTVVLEQTPEGWVTDQGELISNRTLSPVIETTRRLQFQDVRTATGARPIRTMFLHYVSGAMQRIELLSDDGANWARFHFEGIEADTTLYEGREFLIDGITALELMPEL